MRPLRGTARALKLLQGRRRGAVALAAVLLGCGGAESPEGAPKTAAPPRVVLLYATCTVNKGFLSPYGPGVDLTPHLTAWAARGTVFERHRTEAGMSGIAYASILSGRGSAGHGVFTHPERLDEAVPTILETFARGGYEVYAWSAHPMAGEDLGYLRGVAPENLSPHALTPEAADYGRFEALLARVAADPAVRAFVFTHFTVTHGPYDERPVPAFCRDYPGECGILEELSRAEERRLKRLYHEYHEQLAFNFPEATRRLRLAPEEIARLARLLELFYKANVWRLDGLFGGVVETIRSAGLENETLIVFTADHGESLYDPAAPFQWSHSHSLAAAALDAPLIMAWPGHLPAGARYASVTRSIDLFSTLTALAGLPPPDALEGVNLAPAILGESPPPELAAFSHAGVLPADLIGRPAFTTERLREFYPEPSMEATWVALREGDAVWKLVQRGRGWEAERYDLAADPGERVNLFDPDAPEDMERLEALKAYRGRLVEAWREREARREGAPSITDAERERKLRSLGYLR